MSRHLQREVEALKRNLLMIGTAVEEAIEQSFRALLSCDHALAATVITNDEKIDEWEIEIEEDCLKLLALYRPADKDLRFIIAALKMNNSLERMGDLAVNLAEMVSGVCKSEGFALPGHMKEMVKLVRKMVRCVGDALIREDTTLCIDITKQDHRVDALNLETCRAAEKAIESDPAGVRNHLGVIRASRQLERMADLATNIAEEIVYMLTGNIIRHKADE